jgi:DNA-directed RNA polymerase specialized sigma24 family protein
MCSPDPCSSPQPDFERLVRGIRAGDTACADELCDLLYPGIRFFVSRSSDAIEEIAGKVLRDLIRAIQDGDVREPHRLLACVRQIVHGHLRGSDTPQSRGLEVHARTVDDIRRGLTKLPERERDALIRFYVLGQKEEQILAEIQLSREQFRKLKSSAKAWLSATAE